MSTTAPPTAPPTSTEYLTAVRDGWAQAMQQWADQSTSAWDQWAQWSQAWTGALPPRAGGTAPTQGGSTKPGHQHDRHDHAHDHRNEQACGCRGDSCDCCVPEADVVVHARAGEARVVPFRLANRWRREREVTLAVGPWHVCGGRALAVRGVLEEEKVVLAPCEDRIVRLLVSVRGTVKAGDPAEPTDADAADAPTTVGLRTPDVDECTSAYADVRFEGCSRPLRVAVVVSPALCDPVDACCDCGCCC